MYDERNQSLALGGIIYYLIPVESKGFDRYDTFDTKIMASLVSQRHSRYKLHSIIWVAPTLQYL